MAGPRRLFSDSDDEHLVEYLAEEKPAPFGRLGHNIYKKLVEPDSKWEWGNRHSWQSWRQRYKDHQGYLDNKIKKYQQAHGISAEEKKTAEKVKISSKSKPKSAENGSKTSPSRRYVLFTEEDDIYLLKYIAKYNPGTQGRRGNALYQNLVKNVDGKWSFAKRHSWESWRDRYSSRKAWFDQRIEEYQRKKGWPMENPKPEKGARKVIENGDRKRKVLKRPKRVESDSEEDQHGEDEQEVVEAEDRGEGPSSIPLPLPTSREKASKTAPIKRKLVAQKRVTPKMLEDWKRDELRRFGLAGSDDEDHQTTEDEQEVVETGDRGEGPSPTLLRVPTPQKRKRVSETVPMNGKKVDRTNPPDDDDSDTEEETPGGIRHSMTRNLQREEEEEQTQQSFPIPTSRSSPASIPRKRQKTPTIVQSHPPVEVLPDTDTQYVDAEESVVQYYTPAEVLPNTVTQYVDAEDSIAPSHPPVEVLHDNDSQYVDAEEGEDWEDEQLDELEEDEVAHPRKAPASESDYRCEIFREKTEEKEVEQLDDDDDEEQEQLSINGDLEEVQSQNYKSDSSDDEEEEEINAMLTDDSAVDDDAKEERNPDEDSDITVDYDMVSHDHDRQVALGSHSQVRSSQGLPQSQSNGERIYPDINTVPRPNSRLGFEGDQEDKEDTPRSRGSYLRARQAAALNAHVKKPPMYEIEKEQSSKALHPSQEPTPPVSGLDEGGMMLDDDGAGDDISSQAPFSSPVRSDAALPTFSQGRPAANTALPASSPSIKQPISSTSSAVVTTRNPLKPKPKRKRSLATDDFFGPSPPTPPRDSQATPVISHRPKQPNTIVEGPWRNAFKGASRQGSSTSSSDEEDASKKKKVWPPPRKKARTAGGTHAIPTAMPIENAPPVADSSRESQRIDKGKGKEVVDQRAESLVTSEGSSQEVKSLSLVNPIPTSARSAALNLASIQYPQHIQVDNVASSSRVTLPSTQTRKALSAALPKQSVPDDRSKGDDNADPVKTEPTPSPMVLQSPKDGNAEVNKPSMKPAPEDSLRSRIAKPIKLENNSASIPRVSALRREIDFSHHPSYKDTPAHDDPFKEDSTPIANRKSYAAEQTEQQYPAPLPRIDFRREVSAKRARLSLPARISNISPDSATLLDSRSSTRFPSVSSNIAPDDQGLINNLGLKQAIGMIAKQQGFAESIVWAMYNETKSIRKTDVSIRHMARAAEEAGLAWIAKEAGNGVVDGKLISEEVKSRRQSTASVAGGSASNSRRQSRKQTLRLRPPPDDDELSDYTPPSSTRAGKYARLAQRGLEKEAQKREGKRASIGSPLPRLSAHRKDTPSPLTSAHRKDTQSPPTADKDAQGDEKGHMHSPPAKLAASHSATSRELKTMGLSEDHIEKDAQGDEKGHPHSPPAKLATSHSATSREPKTMGLSEEHIELFANATRDNLEVLREIERTVDRRALLNWMVMHHTAIANGNKEAG